MKQELSTKLRAVWLSPILSIAILSMGMFLSGCGALRTTSISEIGNHTADEGPVNAEVEITIEDFVFVPAEATIAPGTRVTWVNKDDAPHTATSTDDRFGSDGLDTNDKYSFVFREKGDFQYYCALHPHMKGVIKVQ
jgi:plastocyanin